MLPSTREALYCCGVPSPRYRGGLDRWPTASTVNTSSANLLENQPIESEQSRGTVGSQMIGQRALRYFDWLERACVSGVYGWLVARIVDAYLETGNAANFVLLASEGLVVFFILIRRTTDR